MIINRPIHISWCFYAGVCGAIVGVIMSLATRWTIFLEGFWLILASCLVIIAFMRPTRLTLAFTFVAGLIFANFRVAPEIIDQDYLARLSGQTITISGSISEDPDLSDTSPALRVSQLKLYPPDASSDSTKDTDVPSTGSPISLSGTLYVQLSRTADIERTDIITLKGKLSDGFGTFAGTMFRPEVISIEKLDPGDIFAKFKNFFASIVRAHISSPEVDLGLGYLMGMKTGLSESFSEALRAVGMTHVVVASGAHLSILTNAIRKLFGKISKFSGLMFSLLIIIAFALVVGFTPSMTRASLVAALGILVGYVGRQFTPLRLISFVAMLTLLISPTNLFNLGWQLSFASFFGILVLAPRIQSLLYGGKKPPWPASMLITSAATSIICAPVLIYNFGTLSLLSFVANLIILPTLPYAMLLVLLTGALGFLPWIAGLISKIATPLLSFHIWIIELLSQQKAFIFEPPDGEIWVFLVYLPVILFLTWSPLLKAFRRRRSRQTNLGRNLADYPDPAPP